MEIFFVIIEKSLENRDPFLFPRRRAEKAFVPGRRKKSKREDYKMFYSVDFSLKFTRMFCYILTWVCSVGSFLAGVILAILVHPICLLSAILTPPFC